MIYAHIYGVRGDGITDSTDALQTALDAASATNPPSAVLLPFGTILVGPTSGHTGGILRIGRGVHLRGEGQANTIIKVKDGAGDYLTVLSGTGDSSGATLRDLTIDQNADGNPVTDVRTLLTGSPRLAFYATAGTHITVEHCTFKNIDAINTVSINGTGVKHPVVRDCVFTNVGGWMAHDYSAVYLHSAEGSTVRGCTFEGVPGGLGARTAIETHGPGQIVMDNFVSDFYQGANIVGDPGQSASVTHNIFARVLIGIHLWSAGPNPVGLSQVDVSHNIVTLERDAWISGPADYARGILLDANPTARYEQIHIADNVVAQLPFSHTALADELQGAGVSVYLTAQSVAGLEIVNNTITGVLSSGIRLHGDVRRALIDGNRLTDCGQAPTGYTWYRTGITVAGSLTDARITNNQVHDTRATRFMCQGINAGALVTTRCVANGNTMSCTDGTVLPAIVQTPAGLFATS